MRNSGNYDYDNNDEKDDYELEYEDRTKRQIIEINREINKEVTGIGEMELINEETPKEWVRDPSTPRCMERNDSPPRPR